MADIYPGDISPHVHKVKRTKINGIRVERNKTKTLILPAPLTIPTCLQVAFLTGCIL